jgi:O-antigen/teichoic acid export membrane protein
MPFGKYFRSVPSLLRSPDARHALELGLARFLGPIGGLIANVAVARILGTEGRGQIAAVLVLFGTFETLLAFGTPELIARDIARKALPRGAAKTLSQYAAAASILPGVAVAFYCHHLGFSWAIAVFVGVLMPATTVTYMARGVLLGNHQYRKLTISHLIFGAVKIVAPLLLVIVDNPSTSLGLFVFVSGTAAAAIPILASKPFAGIAAPFKTVVPILKESLIAWPMSATWPLYIRSDQLILVATSSTAELGRYAICVAIAEIPMALSGGPRQILMARAAKSGSLIELRTIAQIIPIIGLFGAALCVVTAEPAITFVFGPEFSGLSLVVAALVLASAFEIALGILNAGLLVDQRVKKALAIQTVALVFLLATLPLVISLEGGLLAVASVRAATSGFAFFWSRMSLR